MHIEVLPDRILVGTPDFVPRFLDLPRVLQVLAGQTVELPADSTWDTIEVAGTLRVSRTRPTTVRFTHLFVLPGGHLDCGIDDANDPIPANIHVELIVRDVPLDPRDPFQWGNGLVNFGTQDRCGAPKLAWAIATDGLARGATSVTLDRDPVGWQVGDELFVAETHIVPAAIPRGLQPFTPESHLTIAGVNGRVITFSKPLDVDHLPIRKPNGDVVILPHIANLTRNVVLRSENPNGTPGHAANAGMDAMWCECYSEIRGMGRTKNVILNDINPTTLVPGTNQKGRYADHQHHAMGFGSVSKGNVLVGSGQLVGPKWGMALHNVHDALIEDNICIGFPGAGFVTEDGNEVRNVFRNNLAAYCRGPHDGTPGAESSAIKVTNPGAMGNGFFFRGVKNSFDGNVACNNFIGHDFFTQEIGSFTPLFYPSVPGGPSDTRLTLVDNVPVSFTDNVGYSNAVTNMEDWFVSKFTKQRTTLAFGGQFQFLQGTSNPAAPVFDGFVCVGDSGQTFGMTSSLAYAQEMTLRNGEIVGCEIGIPDGGANGFVDLENIHFQNVLDIDYRDLPQTTRHTNCTHVPLGTNPPFYIKFGRAGVWDGTGTPPPTGVSVCRAQQGSKQYLTNWQGTGKDYVLLTEQQLGSLPDPYSSNPPIAMAFDTPLAGVSVEESWDTLGHAPFGDMVRAAGAVRLDGIPLGYAREGHASTLGPPRMIITSPTPRAPAFTFMQEGSPNRQIRLYGVLTGDPSGTSGDIMLSLDDGAPVQWSKNPDILGADNFTMTMDAPAEGPHVAITWRLVTGGTGPADSIVASRMEFPFVVGQVTVPPPVPPPAPVLSTPLLDGATTVTGTARAAASITVYVDGVATGTGLVGNAVTAFTVTVPALTIGQRVTATQTLAGLTSSLSSVVTVEAMPPPTFQLTVINGTGSGLYANHAWVAIVANPAPTGQQFDRWTGATVTDPTLPSTTLMMPNAATTVTATYAVIPEPPPGNWHDITWQQLGTELVFRVKP